MKKILLLLLTLGAFWVAIPWSSLGLEKVNTILHLDQIDRKLGAYKLGLDLHGGVELDYLVDFPTDMTAERKTQVLEDMKTILDGRVRRIGTTEPTLNTAQYGNETHIIVQIPTPSENDAFSPEARQQKNIEFIQEAKKVIGQVVKIQFKEQRSQEDYDSLLKDRGTVVSAIEKDFEKNRNTFDTFAARVADNYENVFYLKNNDLRSLVGTPKDPLTVESLKKILPSLNMTEESEATFSGKIDTVTIGGESKTGTMFISLESIDGSKIQNTTPVTARSLYIDSKPLRFQPAVGDNDEILNEKHLINTLPNMDPNTGRYVVNLIFDTDGQKMFGEITGRNIGKSIAIFLGNQLLTEANVSQRIDGNAIITPGAQPDTKKWATALSKQINEGIVPVGIYEHSEQTVGPNLGKASLKQLIISGILGIIVIGIFLFWRYGLSGIVASLSLVIYLIFLLAMVRIFGVTLTLSGVAGIVLSLGIAIDSNILLLERVQDFLNQGKDMKTALKSGFREAWSAVWDSNITGLVVGVVLWWMGVSLVKGFGQMTVLGIIVSLVVVKHICNPLTIWLRDRALQR